MHRRTTSRRGSRRGTPNGRTPTNNAISPFVEKTYELVSVGCMSNNQESKNKDLVRWSEAGDTLIIQDINTFSDKILPEYFNHCNYSSFIRQLNMYGFRKENREKKTGQEEYRHEFFKKNHKELLKNITRKRRNEDSELSSARKVDMFSSRDLNSRQGNAILMNKPFSSRAVSNMIDLTPEDIAQIKPEIIQDV